jgi:hypothetical protein
MLRNFLCIKKEPDEASPGLGVVVVSSIGGGRPEAGLSDCEIYHLVPATSSGDIVSDENLADLADDGAIMSRYLREGIILQRLSTH